MPKGYDYFIDYEPRHPRLGQRQTLQSVLLLDSR